MSKFSIKALAATGALALTVGFAGSASAVPTVTTNTVLATPIADAADLLDPTLTSGAVFIDITGNDLVNPHPNRRSPYDGEAAVNTALYHSVSAGASATYAFGSDRSLFELMWGSPDSYNTLEFFDDGGSVFTLTGSAVVPPGTPGLGFVNVAVSGLTFDSVVFTSSTDAFEFTNVSAIPLPASLLMLLSAMSGLGFLTWRKAAYAIA